VVGEILIGVEGVEANIAITVPVTVNALYVSKPRHAVLAVDKELLLSARELREASL